jgi:FkbM family methyltransferase
MHTLLFSRLVRNSGKVYAFEPAPDVLAELRRNIALNQLANVHIVAVAVTDMIGQGAFLLDPNRAVGHLEGSPAEQGERLLVQTTTIDDLVLKEGFRPPTFMKVDVEGAESRVLRGASQVIDRYRPVMLIELHTPQEDVAVGAFLAAHRYRACRVETGQEVEDLGAGWPDPRGVWGHILAFPQER